MRSKKTIIIIVSCLLILLFTGAGYYHKSPWLINCFFINMSDDFTEAQPNLYISNDTPDIIKDSIISLIMKADKRVCEFWNSDNRTGEPVIIFCYSEYLLNNYSSNNFILTYKTPLKSFIVFHKSRIDIDMLSHEMFHTELCARTGYFTNVKLPVWFDEGCAMQVDFRKEYSQERYSEIKDSINFDLSQISTPGNFYSGEFYSHFVCARHEVSSWISAAGKEAFFELIRRINEGEDFYYTYNKLKD